MTIRSKQWYTKARRLPNSFAKVSIGRLRLFLSATRSSGRRPVEIKATGGSGEGRKGLRERNRRFRSLGQHTNPHRREGRAHIGTLLAFKNFKYVWVGLGRRNGGGAEAPTFRGPDWFFPWAVN